MRLATTMGIDFLQKSPDLCFLIYVFQWIIYLVWSLSGLPNRRMVCWPILSEAISLTQHEISDIKIIMGDQVLAFYLMWWN